MSIAETIVSLTNELNQKAKLVAISKTKPNEDILEAYEVGQRIFGENKIQDLVKKYEELPKDIEWHFIGHLQTNKVKFLAPFVSLIHAIDSLKLLQVIDKEAKKVKRKIPCLLQVYIAKEESKFGLSDIEIDEILNSEYYLNEVNSEFGFEIVGVMGMATYTDDLMQIRREFKSLKMTFDRLKTQYFSKNENFKEISMGMSGDYTIAVEEGSTMVRIGSTIFGQRY